jgi:TRAP-type C4-dicarboxylate transport system permease large subunit
MSCGFDDVWVGILIMKMAGIGSITPPVGMVCYVVKAIVGDIVTLQGLFRGIWPFVAADVVTIFLLVVFPQITLWLPTMMFK